MQMNIAEKIDKEAFNVICTELKNIKISYSTKCYYFTFYIHNSKRLLFSQDYFSSVFLTKLKTIAIILLNQKKFWLRSKLEKFVLTTWSVFRLDYFSDIS